MLCLRAAVESSGLAGFCSRRSGGATPFLRCCDRFSRFGSDRFSRSSCSSFFRFRCRGLSRLSYNFNRSHQLRPQRFWSAMVAMTQRLDMRCFFFRPQLSVRTVSALVLKVFRNGSGCHGHSVAGPVPSGLSNFAHSAKIHGLPLSPVSRVSRPSSPRAKRWAS